MSDWVVKVLKSGNEKSPVRTMVTLLAQLRFRLSVSRNKRRKIELDGYKRMFPVYITDSLTDMGVVDWAMGMLRITDEARDMSPFFGR